jgi:anti-anti-sigma regulatory factor
MKFFLIVAKGKHKGMPIEIKVDLFMIGSAKMCQLRSQKPGVGAEHCALVMRDRKVFIRDMNSGHVTVVNGSAMPPSQEWPIHAGDRLEVGPLEFVVQMREKALSQRDTEEWALKCLDVSGAIATTYEALEDDEISRPSNAAQAAAAIIDRLQVQRGLVLGRLRIGIEQGITHVRLTDAQMIDDAEIALVKKELCDNLGRNNLRILIDFKNVKRMSSAAAKMFTEFYTWARNYGSTLALCRLRPDLKDMLSTMGLSVPVFDTKSASVHERW